MTWFRTINIEGVPKAYERFEHKPAPIPLDATSGETLPEVMPDFEGTFDEYLEARAQWLSVYARQAFDHCRVLWAAKKIVPTDWTLPKEAP